MIAETLGGTITQLNIVVTVHCQDIIQCMIQYNIPKLCMDGICYMQLI